MKSLTLKGFKSFASATTLHFEPGITAVVGPNGSGKSNVVDAIAWVLGEQGAKALRGGKMEDVIFAGTADRPPLGRAEVTLTIDNSDGALPIDYTEVSITRRMFRDGAGEYEINGSSCRLLDIQELLSDSGIGREMHVIVGQGQLDAVLSARPEDRRGFIEEAAGVLKHRKRREKAERRLTGMQANLARVTDLTSELRRQLKPLGRQAEVARRAAGVQADLRDSRARLLADDLAALTERIAQDSRAEQEAQQLRARLEAELAEATRTEDAAVRAVAEATPALQAAQDTWFALSALVERYRGTVSLARERARNLAGGTTAAAPGRDPDELEAAADRAEADQAERQDAVDGARETLAEAAADRADAEVALQAAEAAFVRASRAVADRREGLARLAGQVNTARSRSTAGAEEATRLAAAVAEARERAAAAEDQFAVLQESVGDLDSGEVGLDEDHEAAAEAARVAAARVRELVEAHRTAGTAATGLRARVDALSLSLDHKDGAGAVLAADALRGVLGPVSALLTIAPGAEAALAAALGPVTDAVAVADADAAVAALDLLREQEAGRAGLVIGTDAARPGQQDRPALPDGATWAADLVTAPGPVRAAVDRVLRDVVVVADLAAARRLVADLPDVLAVTRTGEQLGSHWAVGGSAGRQSVLEIQAAVDRARTDLDTTTATLGELDAALVGARQEAERCRAAAETTLAALHESDAQMSAVAEQLSRSGAAARSAAAEADRLEQRRVAAENARDQHQAALTELEERLLAAESEESPEEIDPAERDALTQRTAAARNREVEARLVVRTVEERARASAGTADNLRRAARAERESRARAVAAAARRQAAAVVAEQVVDLGQRITRSLETSLAAASADRENAAARRTRTDAELQTARARTAEVKTQWDRLTDAVHRDEVVRAQQALRVDQLAERALAEFAMSGTDLLESFGPQVPVPPTAVEMAEYRAARERGETVSEPLPMEFDRDTQERRARRAERDLATLGKVNPLALEEFAALEERHAFLSTQLEDLKATRKDLLSVIQDVDDKILEVFASAYADVAREFVTVFATLFPGGEGELVLTDPDDLLTTGIEVHARPPGKKVKRLSLLSGGERSLTAVALLVAIFRARPSPFYIMDEVEAALDEVNLTRLVGLMTELRESSQLIVITHQKFTMESADALYGVSMRGDGITAVISQRIRGAEERVQGRRALAGGASSPSG
nr:chromosome segregation protein SMC [Nakamurella flavida]